MSVEKNRNILREQEAKYAAATPLDLLNQIDDYERALAVFVKQKQPSVPPSLEQIGQMKPFGIN